jgi:hypothetical protein
MGFNAGLEAMLLKRIQIDLIVQVSHIVEFAEVV